MVRRLKKDVLTQLPPKRRTQVGEPGLHFVCDQQGKEKHPAWIHDISFPAEALASHRCHMHALLNPREKHKSHRVRIAGFLLSIASVEKIGTNESFAI